MCRNWITRDGSSGFPAESGRYHLYVSYACPWAHRSLIMRKLKGLEDVISVDVVDYFMGEKGWRFNPDVPGATADTVNGCSFLREVYFLADPNYGGRFTVAALWDKKKKTIVNNESSELIRMFNSEFNEFCKTPEQRALDFYPEKLRAEIDSINEWIYKYVHVHVHVSVDLTNIPSKWGVLSHRDINNGVYRAGFATQQGPYDKAVREVFAALDRAEEILSRQRYLTGAQITEADIRLYTTLARFDCVYVGHFKVRPASDFCVKSPTVTITLMQKTIHNSVAQV